MRAPVGDDWVGDIIRRLQLEFPDVPQRYVQTIVHRCLMSLEMRLKPVEVLAGTVEDVARRCLSNERH